MSSDDSMPSIENGAGGSAEGEVVGAKVTNGTTSTVPFLSTNSATHTPRKVALCSFEADSYRLVRI